MRDIYVDEDVPRTLGVYDVLGRVHLKLLVYVAPVISLPDLDASCQSVGVGWRRPNVGFPGDVDARHGGKLGQPPYTSPIHFRCSLCNGTYRYRPSSTLKYLDTQNACREFRKNQRLTLPLSPAST